MEKTLTTMRKIKLSQSFSVLTEKKGCFEKAENQGVDRMAFSRSLTIWIFSRFISELIIWILSIGKAT